jgi:hypothetical protein
MGGRRGEDMKGKRIVQALKSPLVHIKVPLHFSKKGREKWKS